MATDITGVEWEDEVAEEVVVYRDGT